MAAMHFDADFVLPTEKMRERAKYIPLRLTYEERKVAALLISHVIASFTLIL